MGTLIMEYGLTETDFRGAEFAAWNVPLTGCFDLLALTRPDIITDIHNRYLEAGADIISTCSFGANDLSLARYGLLGYARRIGRASAELARHAADIHKRRNPFKSRYVAGSVGPAVSTSDSGNTTSDISFDKPAQGRLSESYLEQIEGLIEGGADILLFETILDTRGCEAAIEAAEIIFAKSGVRLPVIISATLSEEGRLLSGESIEDFCASAAKARPLAVGFNCSFGARHLLPHITRLADMSDFAVAVCPNAGLPDNSSNYSDSPEEMAACVEEYLRMGIVDIVGGCCGTTPAHIAEIAKVAALYESRTKKPIFSFVNCGENA